jgi:tetratricopeptide (TPR) repeat protein
MWCRSLAICALVLGLAAIATPGYAQTGQVKGKVVDTDGKPVEGAVVTIEGTDSAGRKFTLKTNKTGEFIQIGLQVGDYKISAVKGNLSDAVTRHVGLDQVNLDFTLRPAAAAAGGSPEDAKKAEAVKAAFAEGVTLSNAGKYDEAIAKFNEVIATIPKCTECYANIGATYGQKKDYDQAEAAYKKAIEIDPNYADAYSGLANVYNAEKKFDQAAEASAQAMKLASAAATAAGGTGGASASAIFNQGIILWNAGKIPDAKKQFEDAVKLDPTLADAQYWLGMANLNEGKLPEAAGYFEEYLKLAPTGQYADQAKGVLSQIKK